MVGRHCAEAALDKGHTVRGLGRNPQQLDKSILSRLEHFEKSTGIYDIPALDRAVAGVDAVICAYGFKPEVVIEGQLLLLRAAERAGIKVIYEIHATCSQLISLLRFSMLGPGTTTGLLELGPT